MHCTDRRSRAPDMSGDVDLECAASLIQRFISTYLADKMLRTMRINPKNLMKADGDMKRFFD
jgi:hypothetical protein